MFWFELFVVVIDELYDQVELFGCGFVVGDEFYCVDWYVEEQIDVVEFVFEVIDVGFDQELMWIVFLIEEE